MPPKKQPFGLVPIPKKIHLSQSLKEKPPLERGGITPILPSSQKKNPFEKEKEILTFRALFLKLHLQLVIFSI
jgi:hypothetical protein